MRFCSSDLAAAAALDAIGGFIVERRGVDARSPRRMALSTVRARSITSAGGCHLHYSSYGHIEAMANAVAEGLATRKLTSNASPSWCPMSSRVNRTRSSIRPRLLRSRGACCLRRNHHRCRYPLWPVAIANGQFPRPGRRTLGAGSIARQDRWGVHIEPQPRK